MKHTTKYLMLLATLVLTTSTPLTAMKRLRRKFGRSKKTAPTYGASHKSLGQQPTKSFEQKLGSWGATKDLVSQPQAHTTPKISPWRKFKMFIKNPRTYKSRKKEYQQSTTDFMNQQPKAPSYPARPEYGPAGTNGMRPRSDSTQPPTYTPPKTAWKAGIANVGATMAATAGTGYTMKQTNPVEAASKLPSRQATSEIRVAPMVSTQQRTLTPITQTQYPQIQKIAPPKIKITKQTLTPTISQPPKSTDSATKPPKFVPFNERKKTATPALPPRPTTQKLPTLPKRPSPGTQQKPFITGGPGIMQKTPEQRALQIKKQKQMIKESPATSNQYVF